MRVVSSIKKIFLILTDLIEALASFGFISISSNRYSPCTSMRKYRNYNSSSKRNLIIANEVLTSRWYLTAKGWPREREMVNINRYHCFLGNCSDSSSKRKTSDRVLITRGKKTFYCTWPICYSCMDRERLVRKMTHRLHPSISRDHVTSLS